MRTITSALSRRLRQLQQTAYANADPKAIIWISRPTTTLTSGVYLERQLVGTFPGLSASSIATRRMRVGQDADRVYIAYVAAGQARVRYAATAANMAKHIWIDAGFSESAKDVAIAFDGRMPRTYNGAEFVTDASPWVFWVTPGGELKGRILGLLGDTTLATSGCTRVSAIRATWGDQGGIDFGLIVFFLLSGALYYRQLIRGVWYDAEPVTFGPEGVTWMDIAAFRTWDYRVGVQGITSGGDVYELISQYQGFARHGAEHVEITEASASGALTDIDYLSGTERERIQIAAVLSAPLYGGLYRTGAPQIVSAVNADDGNGDYGKVLQVRFDRHLVAAEVAAQPGTFRLIDSTSHPFIPHSAELGADGLTVTLTFYSFNNARGVCAVSYTPGTVHSMADVLLTATSCTFTPTGLVPGTPAPELVSIENV